MLFGLECREGKICFLTGPGGGRGGHAVEARMFVPVWNRVQVARARSYSTIVSPTISYILLTMETYVHAIEHIRLAREAGAYRVIAFCSL